MKNERQIIIIRDGVSTPVSINIENDVAKNMIQNIERIFELKDAKEALSHWPAGMIILYDAGTKTEYHLIKKSDTEFFLNDCFENNIEAAPNFVFTVIITEDGHIRQLETKEHMKFYNDDGFEVNMDELFNATVSNKLLLRKKQQCGCIHCKEIFNSTEITEYTKEVNGTDTAICPYCGMDGVIGENISPVPITKEFLKAFEL